MRLRKAVLPVAGLGTRFLPATKAIPKEMLPVVDRPLIQYAIEELHAAGIEQIVMVTGRNKSAMEDHFDRAIELEQTLRQRGKIELLAKLEPLVQEAGHLAYVRQADPLGLGHAVWCARELVGNEPFAVLLPDDLVRAPRPVMCQMAEEFERLQSSMVAVMEVAPAETSKYGIVQVDNPANRVEPIHGLVEKPAPGTAPSNLAIIGRYILTPEIFGLLGRVERGAGGEIQLTDAMRLLLATQPIHSFRFTGVRYDCGDMPGFIMANLAFALDNPQLRERLLPCLRGALGEMEACLHE